MLAMDEMKKKQKHAQIESDIIRRSREVLSAREFTRLGIREICERIGITTGMFYRHFRNRNDLLSFCYIDEVAVQLEQAEKAGRGLPLPEQLLLLEMGVVRSSLIMGPEGIFIFLNNENPACDCSVTRSMTRDKITEAIRLSGISLSPGNSPEFVADRMTIILKGLIFEWFTKKDDPSFDFIRCSEAMLRQTSPALLS